MALRITSDIGAEVRPAPPTVAPYADKVAQWGVLERYFVNVAVGDGCNKFQPWANPVSYSADNASWVAYCVRALRHIHGGFGRGAYLA